jgi:hypothetical protein
VIITRNMGKASFFTVIYALIMIKSILNLLMAFRACGSCAGIMIISPSFTWYGFQDLGICTSPSKIYTRFLPHCFDIAEQVVMTCLIIMTGKLIITSLYLTSAFDKNLLFRGGNIRKTVLCVKKNGRQGLHYH